MRPITYVDHVALFLYHRKKEQSLNRDSSIITSVKFYTVKYTENGFALKWT